MTTEAEFDELKRRRDEEIIKAIRAARKKLWPDAPDDAPLEFHAHDYHAGCYCACPTGPCQHEFSGFREVLNDDGEVCGGEQFCQRCGMGSMQHSMRTDF
jgi:hypothetical protein